MSAPGFTPGPWRYQHGVGRNYPYWKIDAGEGTRHVAEIFQHEDATAEQHANAALLAAAPDLFAALRDIFEHCALVHSRWGDGDNRNEAEAAIRAGRAALAKAEGRAS